MTVDDVPVAVVFAGGRGTRLWPLSRDDAPKQFQPLVDNLSLTTSTIERLRTLLPAENIFVSTSSDLARAAEKCLADVPSANLIVETSGKGPQGALALSAATARHRFGDVSLFTCPSDHLIEGDEQFMAAVAEMFRQVEAAPDAVVLLGAVPTRPDPNLGYFVTRREPGAPVAEVVEQIEKPTEAVAEQLLARGSVYWNTMCYAVRAERALEVYRSRRPEMTAAVEDYIESGSDSGYDGPPGSGLELEPFFEEGVRQLIVTGDFAWKDVGTWGRLEQWLSTADAQGAIPSLGPSVKIDAKDVVVASMDGRPVIALGVSDLVIVSHEDAIYVLDRKKAGDVAALDGLRTMLGESRKDLL
jgi:mannose-1-phosphate guanylyltransferase